jgi:hypothetical protein
MAIGSLKGDQFFILLAPFLVVAGAVTCNGISYPNELELVQWVLSIFGHLVSGV